MNEVFEQGAQQKLVLYTEGNEIIAVRLPLRTGGEYVLRDGYLADLTAVVLENTIRFAWHSLEHRIILSDIHGRRDQVVLSDAMNVSQYGGLRLVNREGKLWLFYNSEGTCRISLERVSVPTRGGRGCPGTSGSL